MEKTAQDRLQEKIEMIKNMKCIEWVSLIELNGNAIHFLVDNSYYGGSKKVVKIEYVWNYYAIPKYIFVENLIDKSEKELKEMLEI